MAKNQVRIGVGVQDNATKPIKGIRDAFDRLQKQGGKGFAIGAGAAITAKGFSLLESAASSVINVLGDAITAGSNLNESLSKSNTVFAKNAAEIEKWADTAAEAFGASKQQALEAAGTYGNLFQAFGIGQEKAAEMSMTLVELAADLASFNNTSVDDALVALRSGLSGETEPLKRYGIAISDARMRQELMTQGVKKLGATLTPLQKTTAAYALILKDSTLAQGDFARTSGGLAGVQKKLTARLADTSAMIGQKLVPVVLQLAEAFSTALDSAEDFGENTAKEVDQVGRSLEWLRLVLAGDGAALAAFNARTGESAEALKKQTDATDKGRHAALLLRGAVDDVGDAASDTAADTGDLEQAIKEAGDAAAQTARQVARLDAVLGDLSDTMYGADQRAGDFAKAQQDLKDLLKEKPSRKDALAWAVWKGDVASAKETLFALTYEMKKEEGPAALQAYLLKVQAGLDATDLKARALINTLLLANAAFVSLQNMASRLKDDVFDPSIIVSGKYGSPLPTAPTVAGPTYGTRGTGGILQRATGGPASGLTMVGEQGREIVDLPGGSNVINARDTEKVMGGTTNIINLTVQGDLRARSKEDVVSALQRAAAFIR